MIGGEVFIPKLPSYNILQLANIIAPDIEKRIIGIRPGEKLHEKMISEDEACNTLDCGQFYIVKPFSQNLFSQNYEKYYNAKSFPENTSYSSGENELIDNKLLDKMINDFNC